MTRIQVIYRGRVQGVGFRMTTHHIAQAFEVTGYVKNLPDGAVEMVVEGKAAEIRRFRQELEDRMHDFIQGRTEQESRPQGLYQDFSIQY